MSDHVVCPACHGLGTVPLDRVQDIEAAERQRWAERAAADVAAVEAAFNRAVFEGLARSYETESEE